MPPRPPSIPRPRLTHFLAIPLSTPTSRPQLQTSLRFFRTQIARDSPFPETALRPLGTLHLTLGVLSLGDAERIREALGVLAGVDLGALLGDAVEGHAGQRQRERGAVGRDADVEVEERRSPEPLTLTLRGLRSMHNPSATSVLYAAPVDADGRLGAFCNKLREVFREKGLLADAERGLLLHGTLVNTVYVKGRGRGKMVFDARGQLERWGEIEWMRDVRVERVGLWRMGAVRGADGEEIYVVEGEKKMPV